MPTGKSLSVRVTDCFGAGHPCGNEARVKWLGGARGRCCIAVTVSLLLGGGGCGSTEPGGLNSAGSQDASADQHAGQPSDGSINNIFRVSDAPPPLPPVHDAGNPDGFPVPDPPAVACKDEASDASAADSPDAAEEDDVSPPGDAGDEDQQGDAGDGVACELPPSVCASPDWLVYFVNPTCVAGLCRWEKSYYQCQGSPCVDGACRSRHTAHASK